ncbi:MAG: hypothetical protein QW530_01910 [Candidatus Micrarchaeaceae archaeon]
MHLSGKDIDNAVLAANCVKVQESAKETKLEVKECQKCKQNNAIDAMYCACRSTPLDIKTETEAAKNIKSLKELMIEALKDSKVLDEVGKALLLDANK